MSVTFRQHQNSFPNGVATDTAAGRKQQALQPGHRGATDGAAAPVPAPHSSHFQGRRAPKTLKEPLLQGALLPSRQEGHWAAAPGLAQAEAELPGQAANGASSEVPSRVRCPH